MNTKVIEKRGLLAINLINGIYSKYLILCFFVFLSGSYIYLISPSLSGTNILTAILSPIILIQLVRKKLTISSFFSLTGLFLLIYLSAISIIIDASGPNLRLLRNSMVTFVAVLSSAWLAQNYFTQVCQALKLSLIFYSSIALLQISYLITGAGLNPATQFVDDGFYDLGFSSVGIPSIFSNPNDFSVAVCLVFIFFLFVGRVRDYKYLILAAFCILISGSKTSIVVALMGVALVFSRESLNKFIFIALISILFFSLLLVSYPVDGIGFYAIDRLLATILEFRSGELDPQSSSYVRLSSYLYFFSSYNNFIIGSFEAGKPFIHFADADFDTSLISINPHSFIIELHCLFGIFGLFVFVSLLAALAINLFKNYHWMIALYILVSIVLLSNVSSSIMAYGSFFAFVSVIAVSRGHRSRVK